MTSADAVQVPPDSTPTSSAKLDGTPPESKAEVKPHKPLNRVPRACNACRKQKMRCEIGPDANPPCKRCKHSGIECQFEKPQREANLSAEAGERLRTLEGDVRVLRQDNEALRAETREILHVVRQLQYQLSNPTFDRSPYPPSHGRERAPSLEQRRPPGSLPGHHQGHRNTLPPLSTRNSFEFSSHNPNPSPYSPHGPTQSSYPRPPGLPSMHPTHQPMSSVRSTSGSMLTSLPPIRTNSTDFPSTSGRHGLYPPGPSSNVMYPSSSREFPPAEDNLEEEYNNELPAAGLDEPLEAIRKLGTQQPDGSPMPRARARSLTPSRSGQDRKRRKLSHGVTPNVKHEFPDVVTKGMISETEARELFTIFYTGCSTFLSVFDAKVDTFEALHTKSPFSVNAILMVASQVRDGGGPVSDMTRSLNNEVLHICAQTLFAPVSSFDAVRAVVLLAGWSPNGWLTCGHAVRMALEIGLDQSWPKLVQLIRAGKAADNEEQHELIVSSRTWFCLYLFEHQMSYGNGRPAILKEDDNVRYSHELLAHPLSIEDDARLASTVELMILRERGHEAWQNVTIPGDRNFSEEQHNVLQNTIDDFRKWYATWDQLFAQRYDGKMFYRTSLQIQQLFAEMFHLAVALRTIVGPSDVERMPLIQKRVAAEAIQAARQGLNCCLRSNSYREGLKYAVQYTHIVATFAASFLMRLARLFPQETEATGGTQQIYEQVEELASLLSTIPATRYAKTLRLILDSRKKRLPATVPMEFRPSMAGTRMVPHSQPPQPVGAYHPGGAISNARLEEAQPSALPGAPLIPPIVPSHGPAPSIHHGPPHPAGPLPGQGYPGQPLPRTLGGILNATTAYHPGLTAAPSFTPPNEGMMNIDVQPGQEAPPGWSYDALNGNFALDSFILPYENLGVPQIY